ncbi:Chloramphenicol acetyltransferase (fragment) [Desulfosarcina cetonica]
MIVVAVVHDRNAIQGKFHGVRLPLDNRGIAQEQRLGDPLLGHQVGGADDHRMLSFGQDDALGAALGPKEDLAHELPLRSQAGLQLLDIDRPFGQGRARHTAFHGGFGHGRHHFEQHPRIQWLGDDVVGTEMNRLAAIGADHRVGNVLAGQVGQGVHGGLLHGFVDLGGAHVQGAAEDEGKSQHVVDLVGIIRTAGGHDGVGPDGLGGVVVDFGIRIGQGEDDGLLVHAPERGRREGALDRQAHEHVRAIDRIGQRAGIGIAGQGCLIGIHAFGAAAVDGAPGVAEDQVFRSDPHLDVEPAAGDAGGTGTVDHHPQVFQTATGDGHGVAHGSRRNDRRAMLVIVEDRDGHLFFQGFFNIETIRRLDVLEIDAAKSGFQQAHGADERVGIRRVHLDVEHVDVGKALEQHRLALHDRLAGQGADMPQAQHGGAVGDDRDQVAAIGVVVGSVRVFLDRPAGDGHAGAVGQTEIILAEERFGGDHFGLARAGLAMVAQGLFIEWHGASLIF